MRAGFIVETFTHLALAVTTSPAVALPVFTHFGVTAPFWFAFIGSAVFVVILWPQLTKIAHADERPTPRPLAG